MMRGHPCPRVFSIWFNSRLLVRTRRIKKNTLPGIARFQRALVGEKGTKTLDTHINLIYHTRS